MAVGHITKNTINHCRRRLVDFAGASYVDACHSRGQILADHLHGHLKEVLKGIDFFLERPRAFHVVKYQADLLTHSFQEISKYVVGYAVTKARKHSENYIKAKKVEGNQNALATAFDLIMRCSPIGDLYASSFRKLPAVYGISVDIIEQQIVLKPYLKILIEKEASKWQQ